MSDELNVAFEASFRSMWEAAGEERVTTADGVEIDALVDEFTKSNDVAEGQAGRREALTAKIEVLTSDWIENGMRKGGRLTLPGGARCRIASEPFLPTSGRGTVEFTVTQL